MFVLCCFLICTMYFELHIINVRRKYVFLHGLLLLLLLLTIMFNCVHMSIAQPGFYAVFI